MEIIIAMAIAFILGAFVRKPFVLPKKAKKQTETVKEEPTDEKQENYWKQLNDMYSYTGEKIDED